MGSPIQSRLYFGYGANTCAASMAVRCPSAQLVGVARLFRHRFLINQFGVATVVPDSQATVFGLLWTITSADEASLDRFEGVEQGLYQKAEKVVQHRWRQRSALIYLAANVLPGIPRAEYLETILEAAIDRQFPKTYLQELRAWIPCDRRLR